LSKTDDDIFVAETFPDINPVAVKSLTVAKVVDVIFAPETFPEIKPVAVKLFTFAKTDDDILSTVRREATLTVPLKVVLALETTTPEFFK
jgi:hypothetical protein